VYRVLEAIVYYYYYYYYYCCFVYGQDSPILGWKAWGLRSRHALTARDRSSSCWRLL